MKHAILSLNAVHEPQRQYGGAVGGAPLDAFVTPTAAAETQGLVDSLKQEEEVLQQRLAVIDAQLQFEQVC